MKIQITLLGALALMITAVGCKKKEIINWHIQLKVKILTWKVNTLFVTVKQSNKCTVKNDISG